MVKTATQSLPTLDELVARLRAELPKLRARYGVLYLGVFGSYVRGQAKGRSDLDVLVEFDDRPLTLLKFVELERQLSNIVGLKVDLVEKSALKPNIGRRILGEVVPV